VDNLGIGSPVEVLQEMRKFVEGELPRRLGFNFSFAFRALVVFHRDNASYSKMKTNWATENSPFHKGTIIDSWKLASKGLEQALSFADKEMGWCRRAFLPSANALIPLAVAMQRSDRSLNNDDKLNYRRWLCLGALRGKLRNVETAINNCLRELRVHGRPASKALLQSLGKTDARRIKADELDDAAPMWGAV